MRRRSRFNRGPAAAVKRSDGTQGLKKNGVQTQKRNKCEGCGQHIEPGDPFVRLRLKMRYRILNCQSCGGKQKGSKRYHPQCLPPDWNKAMGYDPSAQFPVTHSCVNCGYTQSTAFSKHCPNCGENPMLRKSAGGAVAPPPKPKSADQLTLEAMASLEKAVIAQMRERKKPMPGHDPAKCGAKDSKELCDVCAEFKKWQGIKQRVLRPGSPGEEQAAMVVGLQRLVKLAF